MKLVFMLTILFLLVKVCLYLLGKRFDKKIQRLEELLVPFKETIKEMKKQKEKEHNRRLTIEEYYYLLRYAIRDNELSFDDYRERREAIYLIDYLVHSLDEEMSKNPLIEFKMPVKSYYPKL